MAESSERFPVGFVAHGAPLLAVDPAKGAPLRAWGERLPRPTAILAVSAHWEDAPVTIGAAERAPLVYDFYGFPEKLYQIEYPAPAAPELARRVASIMAGEPVRHDSRGLDHGVWTPLIHLVPDAAVPVLQISMPRTMSGAKLFALGERLAPLRDEGVWILASGNLVHNLGRIDWSETKPPPSWAAEFDAWVAEALASRDWDALMDYAQAAPALALAHPTAEHLRPILVAAGAGAHDPVTFPFEGWEYGSLSRRCVQFGR